jgi:hypothetical protein
MLGWCALPAARAYAFGLYVDAPALAAVATALAQSQAQSAFANADAEAAAVGQLETPNREQTPTPGHTAQPDIIHPKPAPADDTLRYLISLKRANPSRCEVALVLKMARDIAGGRTMLGIVLHR